MSKRLISIAATLTLCAASAFSQSIVKQLKFPSLQPTAVVVNPLLNRTYVVLTDPNVADLPYPFGQHPRIAMIDGATNTVKKTVSLPVGIDFATSIAADFVTGRVYADECAAILIRNGYCQIQTFDADLNVVASLPPITNVAEQPNIVINPVTHRLYYGRGTVESGTDPGVAVADTRTNKYLGTIGLPENEAPKRLAIDLANNRVAVIFGVNNNEVALIDAHASKVLRSTTLDGYFTGLMVDPFRQRIYATDQGGFPNRSTMSVLDDTSLALKKKILLGPGPDKIAVDILANRVYVLNQNRTMSVVDGVGLFLKKTVYGPGERLEFWSGVDVNPITGVVYATTPGDVTEPFVGRLDIVK